MVTTSTPRLAKLLTTISPVPGILASLLLFCSAQVLARADIEASWQRSDISKLKRLYLASELRPPDSPGNRVADNPAAATLGRAIFFDKRFSANQALSCASCHQPDRGFTDGRALSHGVSATMRNAPTVISAANYKWFYWDGRRDSLWSQALIPFEAANEMNSSRVSLLHIVSSDTNYRRQYEKLFGPLPAQDLLSRLPEKAGPYGDLPTRTGWYRISAPLRHQINIFYANIGKSVAAFERTLRFSPTRIDRYAAQLIALAQSNTTNPIIIRSQLLSHAEIAGLKLYLDDSKTHCRNCHNGQLFSNSEFYDINSAKLIGKFADYGRELGMRAAIDDEFNCTSRYSDMPDDEKNRRCRVNSLSREPQPLAVGAFKTPTFETW
ncbi:MAG: cytochrome-c peroxidase [Gammaproteobacteria bacterium]|nr:cytochrome-c peroxidase [Gammaproteobacteria bacterium]NNM11612.1 cytochrome-c peroxidase [Pseudomonadales bacterium]